MIRVKNLSVLLALALSIAATANKRHAGKIKMPNLPTSPPKTASAAPPKEESSVTEHNIKIGGQNIPYKATAATILLEKRKDEPTALVYYHRLHAQRREGSEPAPRRVRLQRRSGIFLRMACTWVRFPPRRVITVNADATPPAPYKLSENPHCLLDKTDLVFLDPVGTGFSHAVGKAQDKDFWASIKTSSHWRNSSTLTSAAPAGGIRQNFSSVKATAPSAPLHFPIICSRMTACTSTASC